MKFIREIDLQLGRRHPRQMHPADIVGLRRQNHRRILHADLVPADNLAQIIRKGMKCRDPPSDDHVVRHDLQIGGGHFSVLHHHDLQEAVLYINSQVLFSHKTDSFTKCLSFPLQHSDSAHDDFPDPCGTRKSGPKWPRSCVF